MIDIQYICSFFPNVKGSDKYLLKEYLQVQILDYLSTTPLASKIVFIGGICLRLVKHIDRFSEDLDFDCKNLSLDEFTQMTDGVVTFLKRIGLQVETRDKENTHLTAFRRNIYFPELLLELGLSGHKDERFLLKIEAQDQGIMYEPKMVNISHCGFFFPLRVAPEIY